MRQQYTVTSRFQKAMHTGPCLHDDKSMAAYLFATEVCTTELSTGIQSSLTIITQGYTEVCQTENNAI